MNIKVSMNEGKKVTAHLKGFDIVSDQPEKDGGQNSAPSPYDYFMASMALCAGYFIKSYCDGRGLNTEGIEITQFNEGESDNRFQQTISIQIKVPEDFPEKHRQGIIRAVEGCTVKKTITLTPTFSVEIV